jgi:hypothetical protein
MDSLIETIQSCGYEKEEQLQAIVIKTLLIILTGMGIETHGSSLQLSFQILFNIYSCTPLNHTHTTITYA